MVYESHINLIKEIESGEIKPVYILHGDEPYFIDVIFDFIDKTLLNEGEKSFNQSVLFGAETDYKTLMDHVRQYPMMSSRRVVLLKEAKGMKELSILDSYFQNLATHTVLVIAHKNGKIDGREKWFKSVKNRPDVGIFLSEQIPDWKLEKWLMDYLAAQKRKIDPTANALLCQYLGNDLEKLINEIAKLELNVDKSEIIRTEHVETYVGISREYNEFELLKAISEGDIEKVQLITKVLMSNVKRNPLFRSLPLLFNYFQKVMIVSQNLRLPDDTLAQKIGVNRYFLLEYRNAARRFSLIKLREIIADLLEADKRVKGISGKFEDEEILKELVGKIMAV